MPSFTPISSGEMAGGPPAVTDRASALEIAATVPLLYLLAAGHSLALGGPPCCSTTRRRTVNFGVCLMSCDANACSIAQARAPDPR